MKLKKTSVLIVIFSMLSLASALADNQKPLYPALDGDWTGGLKMGESWTTYKLHFSTVNGVLKGTVELPPENFQLEGPKMELVRVSLQADRLRFDIPKKDGPVTFEGIVKDGEIPGSFKKGGTSGEALLVRIVVLRPEAWAGAIGEYQNDGESYVSIFKFSQQAEDGNMFYYDSETGRVGGLRAISDTQFFSGRSAGSDFPIDTRAKFQKTSSGEVEKLIWKTKGLPDREIKKTKFYTEEMVTYPNGDIRLAGSLRIPTTPGPHPAIVFCHGSGPGTRNQVSLVAPYFLHHGIAVLGFDKRGVGQSTGDWRRIDFPELASDILAGVKFLQSRKEIDPKKVGLYGISQGGWLVCLAGSLSKDVAFAISHSGPGVSPKEQEFYTIRNMMARAGLSKEEIDEFLEMLSLLYVYARTGQGGDKLDAAVNKLKKNPKLADELPPPSKDIGWEKFYGKQQLGDPGWFFHINVDYDPMPAIAKLKCPALIMFGKHDWTVPVEESVSKIEKTLQETGNHDCTLKVFDNGAHGILEIDKDNPLRSVEPARMIPGYYDFVWSWLEKVLRNDQGRE